jgi:hypothetical protein
MPKTKQLTWLFISRDNVCYQTSGYEIGLRAVYKGFWGIWKSQWKMSNDVERHQNKFGNCKANLT